MPTAALASSAASAAPSSSSTVRGLRVVPEFISPDEEQSLLGHVNSGPWSGVLARRTQHYGYAYDYRQRKLPARTTPVPEWTSFVLDRMRQQGLVPSEFRGEQLIVNEYAPGQGIAAHVDHPTLFGSVVASVSLGSACSMVFARTNINGNKETREVRLPARCCVVMRGDARYVWSHCIPARKSDRVGGARVPRTTTRVSLTFRDVKSRAADKKIQ